MMDHMIFPYNYSKAHYIHFYTGALPYQLRCGKIVVVFSYWLLMTFSYWLLMTFSYWLLMTFSYWLLMTFSYWLLMRKFSFLCACRYATVAWGEERGVDPPKKMKKSWRVHWLNYNTLWMQ